jgi:hypothetical protein
LLFCSLHVNGQGLNGTIYNNESYTTVAEAVVTNATTQRSVSADKQGNYSIPASRGDIIYVTADGYHTKQLVAKPAEPLMVFIKPLSVKLKEYIIRDQTPYQKDSIKTVTYYSKALNKKYVKPQLSSGHGIVVSGLIGAPIQRISRSYKMNKRFKENVRRDLEQGFIDTRYTHELVGSLTGLRGDSLAYFMNGYPMAYDFARYASDMELKTWIMDNYRSYIRNTNRKNTVGTR